MISLTAFTVLIAVSLLNAYVIQHLWLWFVVPLGVHPMTYWHAYGFGLFLSLAAVFNFPTTSLSNMKDITPQLRLMAAASKALAAGMILGVGFVVQEWLMP